MSKSIVAAWAVAALLGPVATHCVAAPPVYGVRDLGALWEDFSSSAHAINNSGTVTGESFTGTQDGAFVYSGGSMQRLGGGFGGDWDYGYGINASGQVTGKAFLNVALGCFCFRAFVSNPGQSSPTPLGTLGGTESVGRGINDSGWVTGWSTLQPGSNVSHAFLYRGGPTPRSADDVAGSLQDLGTLGGTNSQGWAINASGHVTGQAQTAGDATTRAFLYTGGPLKDLGTLGGTNSFGRAINASGKVAGFSALSGDTATHAFLYGGGPLKDLGTLGGTDSFASGINAHGQVVGHSEIAGDAAAHAFLYDGATMYDLNKLVDASGSGWTLLEARGINDLGQIVGTGKLANGRMHAFVLSPVPEPATYALMLAGLGMVAVASRRRRPHPGNTRTGALYSGSFAKSTNQ